MKLKHISTKFILAFTGILTAVFIVLIVVFEICFRVFMNDYIKKNAFSMQDELDVAVTEVINESAYLYGRITHSANTELINRVANAELSREERTEAFTALMSRSAVNAEYFNDVAVFAGGMRFSLNGSAYFGGEEFAVLEDRHDALVYLGNVGDSLVMGVNSSSRGVDTSDIFLFFMSESKISEMCNPSGGEDGYSFIMRSDGYIVSHPDSGLAGRVVVYSDVYNPARAPEYKTETLDGVKRIIATGKSEILNTRYGFDCCFVSVLDYDYYFGGMDIMLIVVVSVSVGVLAVAVVFAIRRARKISKPITLLSDSINATAEPTGEARPSVLPDGDELQQLERNYDEMMKRIFDLMEKSREDMQLQRKLELESLQMQINPHFLYNTLDAISWMARIKKQTEIDKLVMNLAKFFRLFLHNGDRFVTVADEVEMVLSYLEINHVRYPGRVTAHTEIAEDTADIQILKLILQPIIENCLKYAFTERNGNIYVRAFVEGDDLILEVEDDGAGFDVPDDILTRPSNREGGYGLKNVNERIRLQYGEGYGLTITSTVGKGTLVRARLKART